MREDRLLEQIRYIEDHPDKRGLSDPARVVASILSHLRKILNTRQGSALIAEDYGVPDFTDLASNFGLDAIPDIERSINQTILKYEPRLNNVKVVYVPQASDVLSVPFKLEAEIRLEDRVVPVVFETVLEADGRINIKE
ncbi:MAG: type secretion system protein [Desulfovibrionales bacterium]|nr:type secretion system protein [Desulfovibrionales bacterium]